MLPNDPLSGVALTSRDRTHDREMPIWELPDIGLLFHRGLIRQYQDLTIVTVPDRDKPIVVRQRA